MSGLQQHLDTEITGVDVQEQGNSLRVATNTPHLISLGCGRLSTAVTIHPIKQGRVIIGSDQNCDIKVEGTGVQQSHCHIENSHDVITLYPQNGDTTVDGILVDKPIRLSQGCMIGIGRSNYLRFNHPAEANLMKSVLPNTRISMAPIHFLSPDTYTTDRNVNTNEAVNQVQITNGNAYIDGHTNLERELDMTYKEMSKRKPPVVPRKVFRECDQLSNSSGSEPETLNNATNIRAEGVPKTNSIMSKVSKFEYYVRNSQKNNKAVVSNNQNNSEVWSPKVFTSNSLTVNTPAKDVLGSKDAPLNYASVNRSSVNTNNLNDPKIQRKIVLNENNAIEAKNCAYTNVVVKNQVLKIDQMAKSYQGVLTNNQESDSRVQSNSLEYNGRMMKPTMKLQTPSASFNRNPKFNSPITSNSQIASNVDFSNQTSLNKAEMKLHQAQKDRFEEESRKIQEEARLEEILNMCAEYEKQISLGIPTTPTEKKHNKIITNGSLPRGLHNSPNIVQASDGYFRFDTSRNRTDYSPHRHPSPSTQTYISRSPHANHRLNSKNLSSYENVQISPPSGDAQTSYHQNHESGASNPNSIPSNYSSYENFNPELQSPVQNVRQFPITELSSPIMIRKIARNAQNSSNYVGSYEKNFIQNCEFSPSNLRPSDFPRPNNILSPYENVMIKNNVISIGNMASSPKSPNSHSPRTRIKTTYSHKNVISPQYFVFPSPQLNENEREMMHYERQNVSSTKCQGIEKQLSLTEDIPMIDDTEFANELEMRIAKLKPENRINKVDDDKAPLLDPDNIFGGQRRNFEEIKRDLIADIPELDEIHRHIDMDLSQSKSCSDEVLNDSVTTALKKISEDMKGVQLDDEVFEASVRRVEEYIESPNCDGILVETVIDVHKVKLVHEDSGIEQGGTTDEDFKSLEEKESTNQVQPEIVQQKTESEPVPNIEEEIQLKAEKNNYILVQESNEPKLKTVENKETTEAEEKSAVTPDIIETVSKSTNEKSLVRDTNQIEQDIKAFVNQDIESPKEEKKNTPDEVSSHLEVLRCKRKEVLSEIHRVKCKMADIRSQEDDILRELEMEKALIQGEYDSEIAILNLEQGKLIALQEKIRCVELDAQQNRHKQEERQTSQREKVIKATEYVQKIEENFNKRDATLEELRNAQESLENERKIFEDMEFQDLEEEAEWLANREELQNDISALTSKIDTQKSRILNLRFETSNNLNAVVEETKSLQAEYVKHLKKLEDLTNKLQGVEENIKETIREIGVDHDKMNSSIEERISRIKSGDFSPPSSDNDDADYFENTNKNLSEKLVSMDQMSRSMIVDLGEKRSIDDLLDNEKSPQNTESSPTKIYDINITDESTPDKMERSVSSERSKGDSEVTPDREKKGFWERNFDSLSRLKSKDKKNKSKIPDIMSQSLNENMFFNNDNIESEYGSFEKCDSLRSSKRSSKNNLNNNSTNNEKSSKISFSSLGRIIKKDSFRKNKDDKTKRHSLEISNKENIDANVKSEETIEKPDLIEQEQKNGKHRYVKNAKCNNGDNKYLNKCTKAAQQNMTVTPENAKEEYDESEDIDSLEEEVRLIDPVSGNTIQLCEVTKTTNDSLTKKYRKSAGDEIRRYSGEFLASLGENRKVPSQDDIDRISKVTLDAPLLSKNEDMNSLGRRTIDSLREVERNRMAMLEKKGCQVIEDEREKIEELKRRVQNEVMKKYAETQQQLLKDAAASVDSSSPSGDASISLVAVPERNDTTENSSTLDDSVLIEGRDEKQLRHSQTDSYNSGNYIEDEVGGVQDREREDSQLSPRPVSQLSDMSSENGGLSYGLVETPRRPKKSQRIREDLQRPLTRYLPIDQEDLNLRAHIESAGHQVDLCPHVIINATSCRGYLHKLGAKFHGWSKRWFVFDRSSKTLIYYSDKNERKPRGGAYFQVIEEVYLDHLNVSKSPTPLTTFVIKTRQRRYYLMAPSGQAARIWIDVIFTGAQGYTEYMQ